MEKLNIKPFLNLSSRAPYGGFPVVEEGAQFHAAWLETQGMGGAMWAPRDVRVALNSSDTKSQAAVECSSSLASDAARHGVTVTNVTCDM